MVSPNSQLSLPNYRLTLYFQGADIPDIKLVIQFGVPSSLSVWMQRVGRAGRSPGIQAYAVLMVEKSVFQKKKQKRKKTAAVEVEAAESDSERSDDLEEGGDLEGDRDIDEVEMESERIDIESGELEWVKKVEPELRRWIETKGCRRDVVDNYFDNPTRKCE